MLDCNSKRAASCRDVVSGTVITGAVIRSAAVKASNGLVAFRAGNVFMVDFLQEQALMIGATNITLGDSQYLSDSGLARVFLQFDVRSHIGILHKVG
jgi:hypothetical protein